VVAAGRTGIGMLGAAKTQDKDVSSLCILRVFDLFARDVRIN